MGAGVIAPVIEFSSLDSAAFALSLPLNRSFHVQTIASHREKLPSVTGASTPPYGTISDAAKYGTRASIPRGDTPAGRMINGRKNDRRLSQREARKKEKLSLPLRATNFTWGHFPPRLTFSFTRTIPVSRRPCRHTGARGRDTSG